MDIGLTQQDDGSFDIAVANGDIVTDEGLETSVILSLFNDARASVDDEIPNGSDSVLARRGFWGDELLNLATGSLGSLLWLSSRDKIIEESIQKMTERARSSLQWMVQDGIAKTLDVNTERSDSDPIDVLISGTITRPDNRDASFQFSRIWDAQEASV